MNLYRHKASGRIVWIRKDPGAHGGRPTFHAVAVEEDWERQIHSFNEVTLVQEGE